MEEFKKAYLDITGSDPIQITEEAWDTLYDIAQSAGIFISRLSEDCYAARWLGGIEDQMLQEIVNPTILHKAEAKMLKQWYTEIGCSITYGWGCYMPYKKFPEIGIMKEQE